MTLPTMRLAPGGRSPDPYRRLAHGVDAILVRVQIALETVRGTWIDDTLFGLPIDVWLQRPSTTSAEIEGTVRQVLASVPGVLEVEAVTITRRPVLVIEGRIVVQGDDGRESVAIRAEQAAAADPAILAVHILPSVLLPSRDRLSLFPDPPRLVGKADLPPGAWLIADPMLAPGTYTDTLYTSSIPDQSGNGRDLALFATVPSSPLYATRTGTVRLPMTQSTNGVAYLGPVNLGIVEFCLIDWCRHDASLTNTREFGASIANQFGNPVFKSRWISTVGAEGTLEFAAGGVGDPVTDSPVVAFPRDGTPNAWVVQARTRRVSGSVSTWTWILLGDLDDGAGARILHQSTWSESVSMTLTGPGQFQDALEAGRGIELHQGGGTPKEGGGIAAYLGPPPDDDAIALGLISAASRFSTSARDATAALLGVS